MGGCLTKVNLREAFARGTPNEPVVRPEEQKDRATYRKDQLEQHECTERAKC